MRKRSQSMNKAVHWVQRLMDHLYELESMDRRTAKAVAEILRAGCASTVYGEDEIPNWTNVINAYPDLDTGEALLSLSNRAAWNADMNSRYTLEDIYREFGNHQK